MNIISEERLIELIGQYIKEGLTVTMESSLEDLGFDSYKFVKLVIDIEEEYDMEFTDDDLSYKKFDKVKYLYEHICS